MGAVKEMCVLKRRHSGDECELASTLYKCDLRKGNLFGGEVSIQLELLMCGGDVHSILLFSLVARCLETMDVLYMAHVCFYV